MESIIKTLVFLCEADTPDVKSIQDFTSEIQPKISRTSIWESICKDKTISTWCIANIKRYSGIYCSLEDIVSMAYTYKNIKPIQILTMGNMLKSVDYLLPREDWDDSVVVVSEILFKQTMQYRSIDQLRRCALAETIPIRFLYKMSTMFNKWTEYPNSDKVYEIFYGNAGFRFLIDKFYKYQEDSLNILKSSNILIEDVLENILKYYLL